VILVHIFILKGHLASVMISLLFFYRALAALMNLQNRYNSFLGVSGSLDNITKFEKELKQGAEKDGTIEFTRLSHSIEVQNVDFGYDEPNGILKQLNLKINKNQSVAFVGESGSGKTTLVNLRSEEHTSELQSRENLVCRLLLE